MTKVATAATRTKEVPALACSDHLKEIVHRCIGERRKRYQERRRADRGARPFAGLGLKFVKTLRQEVDETIEREQAIARFTSPEDLARRCGLRENEHRSRPLRRALWGSCT